MWMTFTGADVERVKREIEEVIGIDCSHAICASAKQVQHKHKLLCLSLQLLMFQHIVHSLTAGVSSPDGRQLVGKLAFGQDCMLQLRLCSSVVL